VLRKKKALMGKDIPKRGESEGSVSNFLSTSARHDLIKLLGSSQ